MARGDGCTRYREEKEIVRVFDCQFDPGFAGFVDREAGPVLASTWKSKNGRRKGGIGQDSGLFTGLAPKLSLIHI